MSTDPISKGVTLGELCIQSENGFLLRENGEAVHVLEILAGKVSDGKAWVIFGARLLPIENPAILDGWQEGIRVTIVLRPLQLNVPGPSVVAVSLDGAVFHRNTAFQPLVVWPPL